MAAQLLEGKRRGSVMVYDGIGFMYHIDRKGNTKTSLRCINRECPGRSNTVAPFVEGSFVPITKQHNHGEDPLLLEVYLLKRRILERSETEATSLKRIYDDESNRVAIEVASRIGFNEISTTMYKRRRLMRPAVPNTYAELGQLMETELHRFSVPLMENHCTAQLLLVGWRLVHRWYWWGGGWYIGGIGGWRLVHRWYWWVEAGTSVVFASPELLNNSVDSRELHIDTTFKILPRIPKALQLLTFMTVHYDHGFPAITVVMERKTSEAYAAVFQFCRGLMPAYEPALISAAAETFAAPVHGCWFHYALAVFKKAKKGGLYRSNQGTNKLLVKLCMVLPLLPENLILEGYDCIVELASREGISVIVDTFLKYIRRAWLQDALRSQESSYCRKLFCLKEGRRPAPPTRKKYLLQNKKIEEAGRKLASVPPLYSVGEFLQWCAHSVDTFTQRFSNTDEDGCSESDFDEDEENDGVEEEVDIEEEHVTAILQPSPSDDRAGQDQPYYFNYRTCPIIHRVNEPDNEVEYFPQHLVEIQGMELQESLRPGPVDELSFEADDNQPVCVVCLTNSATRMAIPCGHYIVCRVCLPNFIQQVVYHRVTGLGGRIVTTPIRLPITCPECRAIVGQVIPTYH